jgi:acetyl esterase
MPSTRDSTAATLDPRLLDPDAAAVMAIISAAAAGQPPRHRGTVEQARAKSPTPTVDTAQFSVISRDFVAEGTGVGVRLYLPTSRATCGILVYLHGGGWALGDLEINDSVCRRLCETAGVALVSVDYRLAPEHPFPAAVDDAAAVLAWAAAGAPGIPEGIDGPVGVAGLSAGAALAAVLARRSRDGTGPTVTQQLLICPVLDRDFTRSSYRENAEGLLLTAEDMRWFWEMYLPGGDDYRQNPDAVPAAVVDTARLPPATIVVAGADPLRDEAVSYAQRLSRSGVDTELILVEGVMHAFPAFPTIASGQAALVEAGGTVARRMRGNAT